MIRAALVTVLLAAGGCKETSTVHLTFGDTVRTPIGFRCRDASGRALPARALVGRTLRVALLVDFIGLGGLPTCRPTDIARWCTSHSCQVLEGEGLARVCFDEAKGLGVGEDAIKAMGEILGGLAGHLVTGDAPREPVLVRVVASAQSCAQLASVKAEAYDPAQLVGCALSCPVQLGELSGDVLVELPTLSDQCADGVTACATGTFLQ